MPAPILRGLRIDGAARDSQIHRRRRGPRTWRPRSELELCWSLWRSPRGANNGGRHADRGRRSPTPGVPAPRVASVRQRASDGPYIAQHRRYRRLRRQTARSTRGDTPLIDAARGRAADVTALLADGIDVNAERTRHGAVHRLPGGPHRGRHEAAKRRRPDFAARRLQNGHTDIVAKRRAARCRVNHGRAGRRRLPAGPRRGRHALRIAPT